TAGLHFPEDIILYKVPNAYPIGAEKILISEILKDPMGKNEIPAESGILVLNVQTVYSIFTSVTLDQPVTTRLITVANLIDRTAKVVKIRLGMKVHDIMEAVYPGMVNVFAGGGLMQAYRADEDAVADRNVNFLAAGMFPKYKESPQCSKCGACTDKCPAGLKVNLIADLVDHGKLKETLKYHATDCIGCGSCSYYCLAGRNLSAKVKAAKEAV
ncbi:MAG TPA: 4Fe-4S dicluster domain-containing protein, partial [Mobilitalea sp.]|nr:4Fe-4S dicluster domain-containing protein [Mobilitalea sp.]